MHRLSTGSSVDKADGVPNAINQLAFTRHGQSDVVLLTRHGKQVLGSGIEGTRMKYSRIRYTVRIVWVATDDVWVKKNYPPIHQRLIDNAMYEFLEIGANPNASSKESSTWTDVLTEKEPDTSQTPSVVGRRLYMDDILIPATMWTALYERVEGLLRVCDKWNLSITLTKLY